MCSWCNRRCADARGLGKHRHHCMMRKPEPEEPQHEYVCEWCGRECADQRGLGKHRHHCPLRPEAERGLPIVISTTTESDGVLFRSPNARSGFTGVYPHGDGQWRVEYERRHFGVYATAEEAAHVYKECKAATEAKDEKLNQQKCPSSPVPSEIADEGEFVCDVCGRHFANIQWLGRHIKTCGLTDPSDDALPPKNSIAGAQTSAKSTQGDQLGLLVSAQSRSGYKGVYPVDDGRWKVEVNRQYRGIFESAKEAAQFYKQVIAQDEQPSSNAAGRKKSRVVQQQHDEDYYEETDDEGAWDEEYYCEWCGVRRKTKHDLEDHEDMCAKRNEWLDGDIRGAAAAVFPCDRCQKQFDSKFSLARHYLSCLNGDGEDLHSASEKNRRRTRSITELEDLVLELEEEGDIDEGQDSAAKAALQAQTAAENACKFRDGKTVQGLGQLGQKARRDYSAQMTRHGVNQKANNLGHSRSGGKRTQSRAKQMSLKKARQQQNKLPKSDRPTIITKNMGESSQHLVGIQCIVKQVNIDGEVHYCLRWSDGRHTWHPQMKLKCPRVIQEFVALSSKDKAERARTMPAEVSHGPLDTVAVPNESFSNQLCPAAAESVTSVLHRAITEGSTAPNDEAESLEATDKGNVKAAQEVPPQIPSQEQPDLGSQQVSDSSDKEILECNNSKAECDSTMAKENDFSHVDTAIAEDGVPHSSGREAVKEDEGGRESRNSDIKHLSFAPFPPVVPVQ